MLLLVRGTIEREEEKGEEQQSEERGGAQPQEGNNNIEQERYSKQLIPLTLNQKERLKCWAKVIFRLYQKILAFFASLYVEIYSAHYPVPLIKLCLECCLNPE
jgi:hypothetical protein